MTTIGCSLFGQSLESLARRCVILGVLKGGFDGGD